VQQVGVLSPLIMSTFLTETIMNRSELQQKLIDSTINGMDFKTMWSVLYDYMDESYDKYSDEELMEEVKEYYPELLEE
jgi:hypothetical protein